MTVIARSSEAVGDLIDWWEEEDLEGDVTILCAPNEVALIISNDEVLLEVPAGRHLLTADAYEDLEDWLDGEDEDVTIAFITTTPVSVDVQGSYTIPDGDDETEVTFTAKARLHVTEASEAIGLLEKLGDDESFEDWLGDEIALHVNSAIEELPVPEALRTTPEMEAESRQFIPLEVTTGRKNDEVAALAMEKAAEVLEAHGIELDGLGDFTWELDEATAQRSLERANREVQARKTKWEQEHPGQAYFISRCPQCHMTAEGPMTCPRCNVAMVAR